MKSAFSMLELIFVIVILGIVLSFAVPKFIDTKDNALVSTIKRDIDTIINSIQTYYLLNKKIDKISDAIQINELNWKIENLKIINNDSCLYIEIKNSNQNTKMIELNVNQSIDTAICKKIRNSGIVSRKIELY